MIRSLGQNQKSCGTIQIRHGHPTLIATAPINNIFMNDSGKPKSKLRGKWGTLPHCFLFPKCEIANILRLLLPTMRESSPREKTSPLHSLNEREFVKKPHVISVVDRIIADKPLKNSEKLLKK